MERAEALAAIAPGKALACLDSLHAPGRLGKKYLATYYFVKWHATFMRDGRLYGFVPSEEAAIYWENRGDVRRAGYTWLYNGIMTKSGGIEDKAALYLDNAQRLATCQTDSLLLFYTYYYQGQLFFHNHEFTEGKLLLRKALDYHRPHVVQPVAHYWLKVAECCFYNDEYAEAEACYSCMWECMDNRRDTISTIRSLFRSVRNIHNLPRQNDLLAFLENNLHDDAYARNCYRLVRAENYLNCRQWDSVRIAMSDISEGTLKPMPELLLRYYKLKGKYSEQLGDYRTAVGAFRNYIHLREHLQDNIRNRRLRQVVTDISRARMENAINLLRIHRLGLLLGIGLLLLAGGGVAWWIVALRKRNLAKLLEAERKADTLHSVCNLLQEKQDNIKSHLMNELAVSRRLAYLSSEGIPRYRSFVQLYDEMLGDFHSSVLEWEKFYQLINYLFDEFHAKLVARYPVLSEKEIQLVCLLKGDFRTDEIAFVMQTTVAAILKRKTVVRQKLALAERSDIAVLVTRQLENEPENANG